MILLDPDHLTVIAYPPDPRHTGLSTRMRASDPEEFATTVISLEEQMRGWLATLGKTRNVREQTAGYDRLVALIRFFERWDIVPFDDQAADEFERLRKAKVRIGSQDLKIASIALSRGALLLSANLRDFRQVPGLRVESWII